jgi:serine O-acetyltransferase
MNLDKIVDSLSDLKNYEYLYRPLAKESPMPSLLDLEQIINDLTKVIFPGFYSDWDLNNVSLKYYVGTYLNKSFKALSEQIYRGLCFGCKQQNPDCSSCKKKSEALASHFFNKLPQIKSLLCTDVIAAYQGDPAATNYGETIFCYPSIKALTHHRIAHELYKLEIPLIPRIIAEMSHSKTGIDIHPGAEIGEFFFIDHGTGVVIGETSIIGKNVRIYQGVTLGAKSFPLDEEGKPIKGIARHPIVEDDVIIYSNSTILGRITIGKSAVVGGNNWITKDIKPYEKVFKKHN